MIGTLGSYLRKTISAVASNGATPVELVAALEAHEVIPWSLTIRNADTVSHLVTLLSAISAIYPVEVPAGGNFALDNAHGFLRTLVGEALQFKIDASGNGTTVTVSGGALQ